MKRKRSDFVAQTGSGQPDIIMWICRCVRCPDVGGSTGDQRSAVVLPALRARRRSEMRGRWNHGKQPGTTRFLKTRSKTRRNFVRRVFGAVLETLSALPRQDKDRYCQDRLRTLVRGKNNWICLVGKRRQVKIARVEAADIWEGRPVGLLVSLGCGRCAADQRCHNFLLLKRGALPRQAWDKHTHRKTQYRQRCSQASARRELSGRSGSGDCSRRRWWWRADRNSKEGEKPADESCAKNAILPCHFRLKMHNFTKTGSGQTRGSTQKRCAFGRRSHTMRLSES
jgi:hypothetical protein